MRIRATTRPATKNGGQSSAGWTRSPSTHAGSGVEEEGVEGNDARPRGSSYRKKGAGVIENTRTRVKMWVWVIKGLS